MKTKTFMDEAVKAVRKGLSANIEPVKIDISKMTKEQWLEERRKGIGASDIGAIMGVNPYRSALEVWHEKVKGLKEEQENISAELGIYLESWLAGKFRNWFAKENNGVVIHVERMPYMLAHPEYPYIRASLDFFFNDPSIMNKAIVECKTTNEFSKKLWDEDELPDSYYLQAQQQLLVTGWNKVYMPCLIGNRKVVVKEIPRNEEIIEKIIETATDFWNNFVLTETPPAPDSSASAARILDELYPKEEAGKVTEFPTFGDEMEMLGKYDKLIEDKKHIEKDIDLIKQKLKAEMGDAEIAICGDKKIVWKTQSRPAYTVKACEFRMFKIYGRKGGK